MQTILRSSPFFPQRLKTIKPSVPILHTSGVCKSDTIGRIFEDRLLTVVGSRKMTHYGQQVMDKLLPPLVRAGVIIVSGFMYGVDQYAHKVCLENNGFTIAVLGWGISWPVLPVEEELYKRIKNHGLIISEYPDKTKPQLWMFPARDRLMAGLSRATLVIEAALRSGSLITASYAKRYRRKLFSVPGPITSSVSAGTNELIKSGQALPVSSAAEILSVLNWPNTKPLLQSKATASGNLVSLLAREPLMLNELSQRLKRSVSELSAQLSILQLQGLVEEKNGKFYLLQKC